MVKNNKNILLFFFLFRIFVHEVHNLLYQVEVVMTDNVLLIILSYLAFFF